MSNFDDKTTSIEGIVSDCINSVVFLICTFIVEWIKNVLFSQKTPAIPVLILNVGELTLFAAFLSRFIRIIKTLFTDVKDLLHDLEVNNIWDNIKTTNWGRATKDSLFHALGWGILSTFIVLIFLFSALLLGQTPRWLYLGLLIFTVISLLYAVANAATSGPFGLMMSSVGFIGSLVFLVSCFLLIIFAIDFVVNLIGYSDALKNLTNFLLFRL
jgi:hypothetical protein